MLTFRVKNICDKIKIMFSVFIRKRNTIIIEYEGTYGLMYWQINILNEDFPTVMIIIPTL